MSSLSILSQPCRQPCPPHPWATREIASGHRYVRNTYPLLTYVHIEAEFVYATCDALKPFT